MTMSKQSIFNKVASHLFKQGKPSMSFDQKGNIEGCLYRGPNGIKCAIGALISDRVYKPAMEGNSIRNLIEYSFEYGFKFPSYFSENKILLQSLQEIHDDEDYVGKNGKYKIKNLRLALKGLAELHGLDYDPMVVEQTA